MSVKDGVIVGSTKIVDHGPDSLRFNIVFLGDGYTATQLADFVQDVGDVVDILHNVTRPYRTVWPALNIHRIDVASAESGTDDPFAGISVRTFFDAGFIGPPNPRHWMRVNTHTVQQVCRTHVPQFHAPVVLANGRRTGGMAPDDVAVISVGGSGPRAQRISKASTVIGHELGHLLGLADEYASDNGCTAPEPARQTYAGPPIAARNVAASTDPLGPSWLSQLSSSSPTVGNPDCRTCGPAVSPVTAGTVGRFEGAHRFHCGVFRSEFECMMRTDAHMCGVCSGEIESVMDLHGPRLDPRGGASWGPGSAKISPFRIGADTFLLRWRPTLFPIPLEFSLARVQPKAAGLDITLASVSDLGKLLVPLNLPDPFLFEYGRFNTSIVAFDLVASLSPIRADGAAVLPPTFSGPLQTPNALVTSAVAFETAGSTFIMLYSTIIGEFSILRVRPDGSGLDQVVGGTWTGGLFDVTAVPGVNGAILVVGNESVTGTVQVGVFDPLSNPPTFTAAGIPTSRPRPAGFTTLTSFTFHDSSILLFYVPGALAGFPTLQGVARFERIFQLDTGGTGIFVATGPVRQPTFVTGMVVAPFELEGDPHLASYFVSTGDTVLEAII